MQYNLTVPPLKEISGSSTLFCFHPTHIHCSTLHSINSSLWSAYPGLGSVLGGGESALSTADTISASRKLIILVRGDGNKQSRKYIVLRRGGVGGKCCEEKQSRGRGSGKVGGSVAFLFIRYSGKFSVTKLHLNRDLKESKERNICIPRGRAFQAKGTAGCKGCEVGACLDCLRNIKKAKMFGAEWQRGVTITKLRDAGQGGNGPSVEQVIVMTLTFTLSKMESL